MNVKAVLDLLAKASTQLEQSARPFDDACTIIKQAHDALDAQAKQQEAMKAAASEVLAILKQAFNYDAPLPIDSHTQKLGLACRKLAASIKAV